MRKRFLDFPRLAHVEALDADRLSLLFQSGEKRMLDLRRAEAHLGQALPRGRVRINQFAALEWPDAPLQLDDLGDLAGLVDLEHSTYSIGADTVRSLSEPFESSLNVNLGHRLKALRKELGLSQEDVAYRIGTQRTYISRVENGHSDLEVQSLKRLVEVGLGRKLEINIR